MFILFTGNSSYGYQIMDRNRHNQTRYVKEATAATLINNKQFKDYNQVSDNLFEVTSSKVRIVHKEPIVVGFFILQYAKLRMLELYYNFLDKYCDKTKFVEIEMDTDSLYMSMSVDSVNDLVSAEKQAEWVQLRSRDCRNEFEADSENNFFPRTCCIVHATYDKRSPGLFKEEFRGTEMVALCSKTYCVKNDTTGVTKFSSKGLNKRSIANDADEEPFAKYMRVLATKQNLSSENHGFQVKGHSIYTYIQNKKGLAYFYPKRVVLEDGINTKPLDI